MFKITKILTVVTMIVAMAASTFGATTWDGGGGDGIESGEAFDDGDASRVLVAGIYLGLSELPGHRHGAGEVVRMGRAETRQLLAHLAQSGRVLGVHMNDPAGRGELLVEQDVSRRVGGGVQVALHDVAVEIDEHHVRRFELGVGHAAGLDHNETAVPIDPAGVTEGQADEAAVDQPLVGDPNLVTQVGESHALAPAAFSRIAIRRFITWPRPPSRVPNASCSGSVVMAKVVDDLFGIHLPGGHNPQQQEREETHGKKLLAGTW